MDRNTIKWKGYIPALVTPFREDGSIDEDGFCKNVERGIGDGYGALIIAGCTGEWWSLEDDERKTLFKLAADTAQGRVPLIAGTVSTSMRSCIELSRYAHDLGMAAMMMPTPSALPNAREIVAYYQAIADAVEGPVVIYNYDHRYVINMLPSIVSELADIDKVVAIKESCGSFQQVLETMRLTQDRIAVIPGFTAYNGLAAAAMGADAIIGASDPVLGKEPAELWETARNGQIQRAREIQSRLTALVKGLNAAGTFVAALKEALTQLGWHGGKPRQPFLPLDGNGKHKVRETLTSLGIS